MRVRLKPKGRIVHNIKQIFDEVHKEKFIAAKVSLSGLQAAVAQYYISRDLDIEAINDQLIGLQLCLDSTHRNVSFKKDAIYAELRAIIRTLNTLGGEKPSNKYDRLMQIYDELQSDVEEFAQTKKYEDAETIRGDFEDIREMESQFMQDDAEYTLYKNIVKQIGLCNGTIIRLSYEKPDGQDSRKMYATFENLYPKIELLNASKKFRDKPKEEKEKEELSDDKIKEINDLSSEQGWNLEQIAEFMGLSSDVIESVLFDKGDDEE